MGKLKGIPAILSPDLMYLLASTGHGDDIVLADINFPVKSICKNGPVEVRADGLKIADLLDGMLQLLPLDAHVDNPVVVMDVMPQDISIKKAVELRWTEYLKIINRHEKRASPVVPEIVERFEFYERTKKAYAIIQTGDMAPYANIIIKRGVVNE